MGTSLAAQDRKPETEAGVHIVHLEGRVWKEVESITGGAAVAVATTAGDRC